MSSLVVNTINTPHKNAGILFLAFLLLYLTHLPLNAATMIFDNGFESGDLTGYKPHLDGGSVSASTSLVPSGKYAGKFELVRKMDQNTFRAENYFDKNKGDFAFNTEYWVGMTFRYEDWVKDSNPEFAPFQVHRRPSSWDVTCGGNVSAFSVAPFLIMTQSDTMKIITMGGVTSWSAPIVKNKWINIVFHFDIGWDNDGYVEAWKDGVKLFRRNGKLHEQIDDCGKPYRSPFLNIGVYKWDWKVGRKATDSSRRLIYIDSVKIAQGADGYSMVSSTASSAPAEAAKDVTPPTISNVQAAVTETSATVTWNTNEASNSTVRYGATTTYGLTAGDNLAVTTHSVTLKDLKAGSLYHYQIISKDSSGNAGSSADLTFTTDKALAESLVAYWPLDPVSGSIVPDVSGNGRNGTLVNGALMTTSGGVKFDGVNDYLNVGKFDVPGKALSISAWVWADSLTNCPYYDCRIISKSTSTAEQDHYFMISPIKVGSAIRLRFRLKTNGVTSTLIAATGNLSTKTWFHVAAVYDGATMRIYKDGVEVGSMAKSGNMTSNSNAFVWIGGNSPGAKSRPWKGQIDDVSIYSYALTKAEIADLAK